MSRYPTHQPWCHISHDGKCPEFQRAAESPETVTLSIRYPDDCIHRAHERCAVEHPHAIASCGMFNHALAAVRDDAARYRTIREALPETDDDTDVISRFVFTTRERPTGNSLRSYCTYQASTRAEFDEQITELADRAEFRELST